MAHDLGITYGHYRAVETGKRLVSVPLLIVIADYYNVSTDYLLGREAPGTASADK